MLHVVLPSNLKKSEKQMEIKIRVKAKKNKKLALKIYEIV